MLVAVNLEMCVFVCVCVENCYVLYQIYIYIHRITNRLCSLEQSGTVQENNTRNGNEGTNKTHLNVNFNHSINLKEKDKSHILT